MTFAKAKPQPMVTCPRCGGRRTIQQYITNYIDHAVYLPCACPDCAGRGVITAAAYRRMSATERRASG